MIVFHQLHVFQGRDSMCQESGNVTYAMQSAILEMSVMLMEKKERLRDIYGLWEFHCNESSIKVWVSTKDWRKYNDSLF